MSKERLQKVLAAAGIASRRRCIGQISDGLCDGPEAASAAVELTIERVV